MATRAEQRDSLFVDSNIRSPSPAADALSLLDEPVELENEALDTTHMPHRDGSTTNNDRIVTSTPISQRTSNQDHNRDINSVSNNIIDPTNPDLQNNANKCINESNNKELDSSNYKTGSSQSGSQTGSPATYHSMGSAGSIHNDNSSFTSSGTQTYDELGERIKTTIIGFEVMEERSRFTVFKVQVKQSIHDSWFIFRRYNDFVRLNDKLKELFPNFRLALPPKRYFGDNYDTKFLRDRQKGLQAFLNLVMGDDDISVSTVVQEFLCLDEPPGAHESLEESKALCESLEEDVYHLQKELEEKDSRISLLEEELELQRLEIENLKKNLKYEKTMKRRPSNQSLVSTAEHNTLTEADQQRYSPKKTSKENSPFKKSPSKDRLASNSPASIAEINEDLPSNDSSLSNSSENPSVMNAKSDSTSASKGFSETETKCQIEGS